MGAFRRVSNLFRRSRVDDEIAAELEAHMAMRGEDYRTRNATFSDMAAYRINMAGVSNGESAQRSWMYEVSGNYFDMLGVQPSLGRFFHESDERGPNSAPYIVLSDAFWRARFNADP